MDREKWLKIDARKKAQRKAVKVEPLAPSEATSSGAVEILDAMQEALDGLDVVDEVAPVVFWPRRVGKSHFGKLVEEMQKVAQSAKVHIPVSLPEFPRMTISANAMICFDEVGKEKIRLGTFDDPWNRPKKSDIEPAPRRRSKREKRIARELDRHRASLGFGEF